MNSTKLISIFCGLTLNCVYSTSFGGDLGKEPVSKGNIGFYASLLYLQPLSDNLKYAVFVSGNQPYQQSWHYQEIHPNYSPAFEVGASYNFAQTPYQATIDWLHLDTSNSTFKQASTNTNDATIEFVVPPYEVGPPVFGIKRADSTVKFAFDSININTNRLFEYDSIIQARLFGGINILRINQTLTTAFSDLPGAQPSPYSYALPPDPLFFFQTQNESKYIGAGPDLGINIRYNAYHGFGVVGQFSGTLTAGRISVVDNFLSNSTRLVAMGLSPSHQSITTPDVTQIVTGFDGRLGLFYNYSGQFFGSYVDTLTIEAGYRLAFYNNAIADVNPGTLVQAGTVVVTPEFATGTMAINSTDARSRNFSVNGPYATAKLALA